MRAHEFIIETAQLLTEDRVQYIATSMKNRLEQAAEKDNAVPRLLGQDTDSLKIAQTLQTMDPDPAGRNLQFLANRYAAGEFSLEDRYHIRAAIELFIKNRARLPIRDLNAVRSIGQLYELVSQFETEPDDQPQSVRARERQIKDREADKPFAGPNFLVVIPRTEAASKLYGRGATWCNVGENDNQFEHYNSQGPFYMILTNLNGRPRKFQLHYEANQFMDELNEPIEKVDIAALSEIPEYKQFLEYLIRKHYSKYIDLS